MYVCYITKFFSHGYGDIITTGGRQPKILMFLRLDIYDQYKCPLKKFFNYDLSNAHFDID